MTFFTKYINVILYFFFFCKVVTSEKKLSIILLLGCLGSGFYSFFAVVNGDISSGRLVFGEMFDPNDLAFFALCFLPFNLIFISREYPLWVRMACMGCFGVSLYLILLTGSRGGLLALCAIFSFFLFSKSMVLKPTLKLTLITLCLVFISFAPINFERYLTLKNISNDYNANSEEGRLAVWIRGLKIMISNPLTGVGIDCFMEAVGTDREIEGALSRAWQAPHNMFVQIGTETGVFGFILFLWLSYNVFSIANKARRFAAQHLLKKIGEISFVGFTGLVISGFFLSQAYSVYWVFYVALSVVINQLVLIEPRNSHEIRSK